MSPNLVASISSELPFVWVAPGKDFAVLSNGVRMAMLFTFGARHLNHLQIIALEERYFCWLGNLFGVFKLFAQSKLLESIVAPRVEISILRDQACVGVSNVNIFDWYFFKNFYSLCMRNLAISLELFEILLMARQLFLSA